MTDGIGYEIRDGLAHVKLDDGRANAMNDRWLWRFGAVLDQVEADDVVAVVLEGRADFFSGGLDLKTLPYLEPKALGATTALFTETMRRCFLFPRPIVAAAAGHCIAGGMMLYLSADIRLAVDSPEAQFGLNEAITGIPLLGGTAGICEYSIPQRHHTELVLHGQTMTARQTHERGISHELVADDASLTTRALARAQKLAGVQSDAYRLNKRILRSRYWEQAVQTAKNLVADVPIHNVFEGLGR